jgi:hypothetical protein
VKEDLDTLAAMAQALTEIPGTIDSAPPRQPAIRVRPDV